MRKGNYKTQLLHSYKVAKRILGSLRLDLPRKDADEGGANPAQQTAK